MKSAAASPSSFGFTGEMTDDPTGLIHLRARYYHPTSGTFLTRDPVMGVIGGPASTFNPYLYVRGNPVNLTDPSGRLARACAMTFNPYVYVRGNPVNLTDPSGRIAPAT